MFAASTLPKVSVAVEIMKPRSPLASATSTSNMSYSTPEQQERPGSALARGIQITEYKDQRVNPDPVLNEESEYLLEDYLSPRKLVCPFWKLDIQDFGIFREKI